MESRYRNMAKMGVVSTGYNQRLAEARAANEVLTRRVQTDPGTASPHEEEVLDRAIAIIVVVIDEVADLMLVAGKEIERMQRLAQMAGPLVHVIMATQRPSVDVITGTSKPIFQRGSAFR